MLVADADVMITAVAGDACALQFASSPELCGGALRGRVLALTIAHNSFVFFLFGAKLRSRFRGVLNQLNAHGPYFAVLLKRLIASFLDVRTGRALTFLRKAARNLSLPSTNLVSTTFGGAYRGGGIHTLDLGGGGGGDLGGGGGG